jgi:hypothetical protein
MTKTPNIDEAERAVDNYLKWLEDPEQLRDESRIAELRDQEAEEGDVLARLQIHGELVRLERLPEEAFLNPFVEHAKTYAEVNSIPAEAFISMGVPNKALKRAKMGARAAKHRETKSTEEISAEILANSWDTFTTKDVATLTGASGSTVKRAIEGLVESGAVIKTDREDLTHAGRGARPKLYEVVRPDETADEESEQE